MSKPQRAASEAFQRTHIKPFFIRTDCARPDDLQDILDIQLEAYDEIYGDLGDDHRRLHIPALVKQLAEEIEHGEIITAKLPNGRLAGFSSSHVAEDAVVIQRLHVTENHKKKSIGSMLMHATASDHLRKNHGNYDQPMMIDIPQNCLAAQKLAKKFGAAHLQGIRTEESFGIPTQISVFRWNSIRSFEKDIKSKWTVNPSIDAQTLDA